MASFRVVIHGSFSKHFREIQEAAKTFEEAGIDVLAPKTGEFAAKNNGFALFEDEIDQDPRLVELLYLHNLRRLGENGFSYFVDPGGYIGKSTSYELGIAQLTNTNCFFSHKPTDHPAYLPKGAIWSPQNLAAYIAENRKLPLTQARRNDKIIHKLWEKLIVPGSVVAVGAIIEHRSARSDQKEKEILLVKTHKWGGRYSIVGGKLRRNERLRDALLREVKEETNLEGEVGQHLCTFDQIKNSGYYKSGVQHIFVDNIVEVDSKKVALNEEAQDYIWALPSQAVKHLDIEPNALKTIKLYQKQRAVLI